MSSSLPPQLFFHTPAQRTALARERFFEHNERPNGLVPRSVEQSWLRCQTAGLQHQQALSDDPVGSARLHTALRRTQALRTAAAPYLERLEKVVAATHCKVLLTNTDGVVVHARTAPSSARQLRLKPLIDRVSRVGMDWSEAFAGTSAPALVLQTGQSSLVQGGEHFYDHAHSLLCAAAPLRNAQGQLLGVLDISAEAERFNFDAITLVHTYAALIEQQLLYLSPDHERMLRFHAAPDLLATPYAALAGLDGDTHLCWLNAMGQSLTGQPGTASADAAFGLTGAQLWALVEGSDPARPVALPLPNGLTVWACAAQRPAAVCDLPQSDDEEGTAAPVNTTSTHKIPADAADASAPPSAAPPDTIRSQRQHMVQQALEHCHGNLSEAARQLGVSRGFIYRCLQEKNARP